MTAVSKVQICNNALNKIGADPITTFTDNSKEARACNLVYNPLRQELLRAHPWKFSMKRQVLVASATAPDFEYAYQYPLPADCLRPLSLYGTNLDYKVEGKNILTDESVVNLIYVSDVEDTTQFDNSFVDTLITRIAAELAYPIANSSAVADVLYRQYELKIKNAKRWDSQQGTPNELESDTWYNVRFV